MAKEPVKLNDYQKNKLRETNSKLKKISNSVAKLKEKTKETYKVHAAAAKAEAKAGKAYEKAKSKYKGRGDAAGKEKLNSAKAAYGQAKKLTRAALSQNNKLVKKHDRQQITQGTLGARSKKYAAGGGKAHNG